MLCANEEGWQAQLTNSAVVSTPPTHNLPPLSPPPPPHPPTPPSLPLTSGVALGAALLGLPWHVTGVCLAGPISYYQQQQEELTAAFCLEHWKPTAAAAAAAGAAAADTAAVQQEVAGRLSWVPRQVPRRFGKVLPGEVAACRAVAQRHGVLLDPIWSLAAWEAASQAAEAAAAAAARCGDQSGRGNGTGSNSGGRGAGGPELVAMLHTGGHLGLCGLAQRHPDQF